MAVLISVESRGNGLGRGPHLVGAGQPLFRALGGGGDPVLASRVRKTVVAAALPMLPAKRRTCDVVNLYSYVAVGAPEGELGFVHLLGWRCALRDVWLTGPLVAVDIRSGVVRTVSGHDYQLRAPDDDALTPDLREHLGYALAMRGYSDVQSL